MSYKAPVAIHPGETLNEILKSENMSQKQLASRTGLHHVTISNILAGKDPISPDTAIKLSMVFGLSEGFWNNLQKNYEETKARISIEKEISKEIEIFKKFTCFTELVKYNYIEKGGSNEEKAKNLLSFLGLVSFKFLKNNYEVAFMKSTSQNLSKENLIAWLRCGEINALKINTRSFNKAKLKNNLEKIRSFNLMDTSEYSKKLRTLLAECGIAIAYVPYLKNTYVNGASKWLSPKKVLIQITPRNKYEDILWFTLFHELYHVLKHGKKRGYISFWSDDYLNKDCIKFEHEADSFAENILISKKKWDDFYSNEKITDKRIIKFASEIGIKPGIVAGRLAKETNNWARYSKLRKKITVGVN